MHTLIISFEKVNLYYISKFFSFLVSIKLEFEIFQELNKFQKDKAETFQNLLRYL